VKNLLYLRFVKILQYSILFILLCNGALPVLEDTVLGQQIDFVYDWFDAQEDCCKDEQKKDSSTSAPGKLNQDRNTESRPNDIEHNSDSEFGSFAIKDQSELVFIDWIIPDFLAKRQIDKKLKRHLHFSKFKDDSLS